MNTFSIIVAVGENNEIGKDGDLLWHLHGDMVYFKNTTKNHPVLMGRKTWDSLQVRPLPKRQNIVITTDKNFEKEKVRVLHSLKEIDALEEFENEVFVIGGGTIYKELLPLCDKLYLTKVHSSFPDADTYFPDINADDWQTVYQSEMKKDDESNLEYQFIILSRLRR
ncbi:MAG: dihydrofolate reductase [Bacteroidales bacterium]|nr:dihydrofolate reductase [Bacteroidales bacterium]